MIKATKFTTFAAGALFAIPNAYATTIHLAFDGGYEMLTTTGTPIVPAAGLTGAMTLEISPLQPQGPYTGSAYIASDEVFLFDYWTAEGSLTGYQNAGFGGAPSYCGDYTMCADSNINFYWNNIVVPLEAAFGLEPSTNMDPSNLVDSIFNSWANGDAAYFSVESLDADGDGLLGTALTSSSFAGYTPYFFGNATVTGVCEDVTDDLLGINTVEVCTEIPQGVEIPEVTVSTVPVPAAVWLFGSGLIALVGITRRKQA